VASPDPLWVLESLGGKHWRQALVVLNSSLDKFEVRERVKYVMVARTLESAFWQAKRFGSCRDERKKVILFLLS
jgi:hypothetical protein